MTTSRFGAQKSTSRSFRIYFAAAILFLALFAPQRSLFCSPTRLFTVSMKSIISALLILPCAVVGFTSPAAMRVAKVAVQHPLQASISTPFMANGDNDAVLRAFEKKEEKYSKLREEARQRLVQYEENLEKLQNKKQDYLAAVQVSKAPPGGNFSETAVRSAVKAFMWRVIAGSVTFITSLRFSGSITTALSIVSSDFLSKSLTMFVGERLMNKSQAGRKTGSDGAGRSLAKALIWRLFAICNTLTMAIFIAKDLSIASKIAGSDAIFKTALMFFYERVWARVQWGKEYLIEFSI
jgi:uncharacterized membrane protein